MGEPVKLKVPLIVAQRKAIASLTETAKAGANEAAKVAADRREAAAKQRIAERPFKLEPQEKKPVNAHDLHQAWVASMEEFYPRQDVSRPWSPGERGCAAQLCKRYPNKDLKKMVRFAVQNYCAYKAVSNDVCGTPTIYNIVKHVAVFLEEMDDGVSPVERRTKLIDKHIAETQPKGAAPKKEASNSKPFNFEEW